MDEAKAQVTWVNCQREFEGGFMIIRLEFKRIRSRQISKEIPNVESHPAVEIRPGRPRRP